jgi:hypothetical protein
MFLIVGGQVLGGCHHTLTLDANDLGIGDFRGQ